MNLSTEQSMKIAKKLKKLAMIDYIVIIAHYLSLILLFLLFIDINNIGMLAGFGLQFIILIPILSLTKYISDVKISKLFQQISDKFEDKNTTILIYSSREYSLKTQWLKFNGRFSYWVILMSVHRVFLPWKLNNYIFNGSKQILNNK